MAHDLPVYQKFAQFLKTLRDAQETQDKGKISLWTKRLNFLVYYYLDDEGRSDLQTIRFALAESNPEKLVFYCTLEHKGEDGEHLAYTPHRVVITPSLEQVLKIRVKGPSRAGAADYIDQRFYSALLMPYKLDIDKVLLA